MSKSLPCRDGLWDRLCHGVATAWLRGSIAVRNSITADELVLVISDGTRETWTRAPAE